MWPSGELKQYVKIITFLMILTAPLWPLSAKQIWAGSLNWSDHTLENGTHVYLRALKPDLPADGLLATLSAGLDFVLSSPFFQAHQPGAFGIFVDGTWTLSSGFFSDSLITPNGEEAILFSPMPLLDADEAKPLIAHELAHLVHRKCRPQEESWVREGVALLVEWIVTGRYNPALTEAFAYPETSLTAPLDPRHADYANIETRTAQYGHILQYFAYIYRLCGKNALLEKILTSPSKRTGVDFIDEVLSSSDGTGGDGTGACAGFHESFRQFSIARFKQDVLSPEGYVLITGLRSTVEPARKPLPAFSSEAYRIGAGQKCASGEIPWGALRCIRVQE